MRRTRSKTRARPSQKSKNHAHPRQNQQAQAPGRGGCHRGLQADPQIRPCVNGHRPMEGQPLTLLGDAGADGGGTAHGGILLLDQFLGQAQKGGVVVGAVNVNDIFCVCCV